MASELGFTTKVAGVPDRTACCLTENLLEGSDAKVETVTSLLNVWEYSVLPVHKVHRDNFKAAARVFPIDSLQNRLFHGTRRAIDFPKI